MGMIDCGNGSDCQIIVTDGTGAGWFDPFLTSDFVLPRGVVVALDVDCAMQQWSIYRLNNSFSTERFAEKNTPNVACVKVEIGFAPKQCVVCAANDMRHVGGYFGDGNGRAVRRLSKFCWDRSKGDLSGVWSFDARMLWVDNDRSWFS